MGEEANLSANAIIAKALENAGVPARNIELPSEAGVESKEGTPSLDGLPKPPVVGQLPVEGEESIPGAAEKPGEAKPDETIVPPLGKADVEAAITEATSKFQGMMDRKINQLQYQMQQTVGALNQFFQSQEDSNISGLSAEEQVTKRLERLEKGGQQPRIQIQPDQPIEQQPAQFYQHLVNFVDTVGLQITDKRIDWAPDTNDPKIGFNRFLASIKVALVEDQTKIIQELKDNGSKVLTSLRKKTGVDKVSTSPPGGAGLPDIDKMTPMQKIEYGFQQQAELSQVNQ